MRSFIDQLFQLRNVSSGTEGVGLRFAHPLPVWAWVFIAIACALVAGWSYWNLLGKKRARIGLAVMRALLLLLVVVLLAGPELVKQNDQIERDWVVVMADRSASMTVADAPGPNGSARTTREQQLTSAVRSSWPVFSGLAQKRNVLFLGFDSGAFDLRTIEGTSTAPAGLDLGLPIGRRTMLGQALDQTLRRIAARPVAGVVVLSDGRSADTVNRSVLRQLESRQIPVFTVPLGSAEPLVDLAVGRIDAPTAAFVGDLVPVSVEVDRLGASPASVIRGKVQLVDDATGTVLDERPLADQPATERLILTARPDQPGQVAWSARLVLDTPDLTQENNRAPVRLELVDRPIRVVYFDGYPRWEYRYLKNILVREKSIKSATLLLASDRRYIQEGTDPIDSLPRTQAGWNPFDVIIMGDLRPGLFSEEQLGQIKKLVAERGAGLLWIGGSAATPGAWRGTALADLLPFTVAGGSEGSSGPQAWLDPVVIRPGPSAARYGVLQLGENSREPWPDMLSSNNLGWNTFRWAQRIEPSTLKPTAEVLALAAPISNARGSSAAPAPLVMTMRYGAGRVVYVATDETWRYRYARGEVLTERFWVPLLRLLARESLGRTGKAAILHASPDRAQVNQQVQVQVRLLDQSFIDRHPESIRVRLLPEASAGRAQADPIELILKPEPPTEEGTPSSVFSTTWLATDPGTFLIEPADPLVAGLDLKARVEVVLPDDELRLPQTDHANLASLSLATGGKVLEPAQLNELPSLLPNRELRLLGTPDIETLWDKPVVWVFLMFLLTFEWVGRRVIKLS